MNLRVCAWWFKERDVDKIEIVKLKIVAHW